MADPQGGYSARTVVRVASRLVAALSIVVGVLLGVTVSQVVSAQSTLDELNPGRVELGEVLARYIDQETGQRGYILTGNVDFLRPYDEAGADIAENLDLLDDQASPRIRAAIEAMTAAHRAWLDEADSELDAARSGDRAQAIQRVADGDGKELFDALRRAHAAADAQVAAEQDDRRRGKCWSRFGESFQ